MNREQGSYNTQQELRKLTGQRGNLKEKSKKKRRIIFKVFQSTSKIT